MRADTGATTRDAITGQDIQCSPADPGNLTCTLRNIPRGQTVTLLAAEAGTGVEFGVTPFLLRENFDPRSIRSQFLDFNGPCTTPERGVCVFTAEADQTITARYAAVKLTTIKFIGAVNWAVSISALPVLGVGPFRQKDFQSVVIQNGITPGLFCELDPLVAVNCYNIMSANNSIIKFEALPPRGPAPLGSSGPLEFIGFDNACNSNTACTVVSEVDETITMKWEYYKCDTSTINPGFNLGPTLSGPAHAGPPPFLEVCTLTRP